MYALGENPIKDWEDIILDSQKVNLDKYFENVEFIENSEQKYNETNKYIKLGFGK